MLPKPYREAFAHVFDQAPSVPYEQVVGVSTTQRVYSVPLTPQVFKADVGLDPMEIFDSFSKEPLASASVAQVHRAVLSPVSGDPERVVAVKVQKPAIAKQMDWDLWSYRCVQGTASLGLAG